MQERTGSKAEKELAKTAMTAAIGIAVLTAPFLRRNRALKNIHISAGILLTGFALWHHLLYQPKKKNRPSGLTITSKESGNPTITPCLRDHIETI